MSSVDLPIPLARLAMQLTPISFLQRAIDVLLGKMERRHARLFKDLKALDRAALLVEPTGVRRRFLLSYGGGAVSLHVLEEGENPEVQASLKGSLKTLFDMLEGREDGDTMFFSRHLSITGDTAALVALRNTLDRDEINLFDEVTSLCGPFAEPVGKLLNHAGRAWADIGAHVEAFHQDLHERKKADDKATLS